MYAYFTDKLDGGAQTRMQALVIAPEKSGRDPFTPVENGDKIVIITPTTYEGQGLTYLEQDVTCTLVSKDLPLDNEGCYLFAYQGEVAGEGEFGSASAGKVRGLIFKTVTSQKEMTATLNPYDEVVCFYDEIYDFETGKWDKLTAPKYISIAAPETGIKMTIPELIMQTGETAYFPAIITPSDAEVTYESEDETIATVSEDGLITFVGEEGQTTVTATIVVDGETHTGELTVKFSE